MPDVVDPKAAALLAEGLTQGEVDYLTSGGRNAEGLAPPADDRFASIDDRLKAAGLPPTSPAAAPRATPPAAPAAAATPPAAAPGATDDEPDDPAELARERDPNYRVPYAQFRREEKARKALAKQLRERDEALTSERTSAQELREKWARVDERLRVFAAATEPAPPAPEAPKAKPDRDADPFGYMAWLEEQVEGLKPKLEAVTTQFQERDAATELQSAYINDARTYAGREPHFGAAYNWLMANRDAELQSIGYADKQERIRIMMADERDVVARALQARQRDPNAPGPAQIIFGLAKARGFQPPAAAGANGANGAASPANGAANGAAAAAAGHPNVTQQVEAIQRGQAASRSLSSAGGAPPPQGFDLEKLIGLSDDEYADYVRQLTPMQRREYQSLIGAAR
jgi:hypothetical protein